MIKFRKLRHSVQPILFALPVDQTLLLWYVMFFGETVLLDVTGCLWKSISCPSVAE